MKISGLAARRLRCHQILPNVQCEGLWCCTWTKETVAGSLCNWELLLSGGRGVCSPFEGIRSTTMYSNYEDQVIPAHETNVDPVQLFFACIQLVCSSLCGGTLVEHLLLEHTVRKRHAHSQQRIRCSISMYLCVRPLFSIP
jgi:hypothetical protein